MKKIAYLVAPLMAMPFIIGCNKVTTHKVDGVVVTSNSLTFTTMKGKALEGSLFNAKKEFKFKVAANNNTGESTYTVEPNGIGIYVGKSDYPLYEGYTVEYTKDDHTEATVTIDGKYTTDDIHIRGIAAKKDNYIYDVILTAGVHVASGAETIGWAPANKEMTIKFQADTGHTTPTKDDFLLAVDGIEFETVDERGASVTDGILKVPANVANKYLLITAKATDIDYLDGLSWSQIKQISDAGLAPLVFNLGSTKKVEIEGNTYSVKIIGFSHDELSSSTSEAPLYAGITFQFNEAISKEGGTAMKTMWENEGSSKDFASSDLNRALELLAGNFPEDLKSVVAEVKKSVGIYKNYAWQLGSYPTKLFPLAHAEMSTKSTSYAVNGEGTIYAYYMDKQQGDQFKLYGCKDTSPSAYWLRTPRINMTGRAWTVDEDGYFVYDSDYAQKVDKADHAVAPAFCI